VRRQNRTNETPEIRDAPSFAQSLSDKQLHCRELGHVWRDHTVAWDAKARVFDRALRCQSCGSIRRQVLDRRGHVVRNGYNYTEGYLATKVMNREGLSRDVFRLEALTRWLEKTNTKAG
jgi:Ribonuclease G/E